MTVEEVDYQLAVSSTRIDESISEDGRRLKQLGSANLALNSSIIYRRHRQQL